jgi:hypothetical protein
MLWFPKKETARSDLAMVCHSAMRDRDLSQTPTPLSLQEDPVQPVWQ